MSSSSRNENGLFGVLETILRKTEEPMDCASLHDVPEVRAHAATINRVSDYLGNMWRKGLVLRLPAPRLEGTRARWLYIWKNKGPTIKPPVDVAEARAYSPNVMQMLSRVNMEITEDGDTVTLTLPTVTITIKQNPR